jgi:protein-disulfide isomerase
MAKRQTGCAPMVCFYFSVLVCLAFSSAIAGQDANPGAAPMLSVGAENAPISIEVFNDYQCPPCAVFNEELEKIGAKHKDDVRIIFRNFPLTHLHQNALSAAQAAEAAGLQGKFSEMINLLYQNQWRWGRSRHASRLFKSYARKLNLDTERFGRDMKGSYVRERIRLDVARARSLNVSGTPTVLVNGQTMSVGELPDISRTIEEALNNKKQ